MGEYATLGREEVKIGTCENMYYLRYDQRFAVRPLSGNVNPSDRTTASELRFRFPWPDEDTVAPGSGVFHDNGYHRGITIPGATVPDGVEHYSVQFVAQAGYNCCLPCPETTDGARVQIVGPAGESTKPLTIHRNGFSGAVQLVAQKPTPDGTILRAVFRCGGCGGMWRADTWADAGPHVVALRAEADRRERQESGGGRFWHTIADRLAAGYCITVETSREDYLAHRKGAVT